MSLRKKKKKKEEEEEEERECILSDWSAYVRGKGVDREQEKGMEGLGEKKRGLIADFDPGTPSVSEHSQPQALQ